MANILTSSEAAVVLRCESSDANMLAMLPQIDAYIKNATGHDWTTDSPIREEAKSAARMLLIKWHEDPGMMAVGESPAFGLKALLIQLEVIALRFKEFLGRDGAGAIELTGARIGDAVSSVTGLRGVSGSQAASFETVITVDDEIQQTAIGDLSDNVYRVYLVPIEEL